MSDLLVRVDGISKKFCRDLRRSLWYGIRDLGSAIFWQSNASDTLRPREFWAVDNVSFQLKRGECLGLIGHNGAGKTTLLRLLNGLLKPDKGRIEITGRVGALIALGAGFNPVLTGRENIYVNAAILGFKPKETKRRLDEIIAFSELGEFIDSPVQHYSSGMYTRLGFSIAAHLEPDVLLVDEALAVGDLAFVIKCINRIADLRRNGTGVIFVSHNELQVREAASAAMLLNNGNRIYLGQVAEAFRQYELIAATASSDSGFVHQGAIQLGIASISDLQTGTDATIEVLCRAKESHAQLDFELRFWNSRGQMVSSIATSNCGGSIALRSGESIVRVHLDRIPLVPGRYRIAGGFRSEGRVLGWSRDLAEVEVAAPTGQWIGSGICAISGSFSSASAHDSSSRS